MILDAITSSPFNVFFTIVIGIGLVYLYYRKPSSSSSTSTRTIRLHSSYTLARPTLSTRGGVIDEELQRAIAQIERQERDMIRQEQDEAYQQSLKLDREKKIKKEEERKNKEAQEKAEKERLARQERIHQRLINLKSDIVQHMPPQPAPGQNDSVKLVFKLPNGTRLKRDFQKSDLVKHLYWYVFSLDNAPLRFKLATNFPKRDLPGRPPLPEDFGEESEPNLDPVEPNSEQTLEETQLTETQIIFVYDLEA